MTKEQDNTIISVLHPICCGLDVHKKTISACIIATDKSGETHCEIKEFETFTDDLILLKDWLLKNDCPIVAIESTGVYWRPVHNVLENDVNVVLVNARHIKNVPGRKTDIGDSKWIAGLLRAGLLKGSFIPDKEVRQWRELVTLRKSHTKTVGDYKRRVHKMFECANIKISSVVSDLFGVTGRNLMDMLCDESATIDIAAIENCARGSLKKKVSELVRSIDGFFEDHHRFQLKSLLSAVDHHLLEIKTITDRLRLLMTDHKDLLDRLDEIHGIDELAAQSVISWIGIDLEDFPTEAAICSWAGLCPGNNESGGKRKTGKSPVRKSPFKTLMVEIAWAAIKKKGSYYKEKYYRFKSKRGAKKAIIAIAHKILKAIYHIIKFGKTFKDPGEDFLIKRNNKKQIYNLRKRAEKLGFKLVAAQEK